MRPFKLTFKTDSNELTTASGTADTNEESFVPGGIVGFQLSFAQVFQNAQSRSKLAVKWLI